jgi:hypothetical protein
MRIDAPTSTSASSGLRSVSLPLCVPAELMKFLWSLAADALARALVLDPVTLVRIADGETGKPQIRRVHLHEMLTAATFQRHRWDFMRLHYQFIMANERRTMYDYFMLVCGPLAFAKSLGAPQGPAELFAPDGSCLAMAGIGGVRPSGQGAPLQT